MTQNTDDQVVAVKADRPLGHEDWEILRGITTELAKLCPVVIEVEFIGRPAHFEVRFDG